MFIEFRSIDDANLALATIHNHPFDTKHIFKVNRFTEIEKYTEMDETYVEPKLDKFEPRVRLLRAAGFSCVLNHFLFDF